MNHLYGTGQYGDPIIRELNEANRKPEMHPVFCALLHDVASGRKDKEEAWKEWCDYCTANGIEPVNRRKP